MSDFAALPRSILSFAGDSIAFILVVKCTVVLAIAWLAHGMLSGRNPRWRVVLWRATMIGVAVVALLSSAPPIVEYRFDPADAITVEKERGTARALPMQNSIEASNTAVAMAPAVASTRQDPHRASNSLSPQPIRSGKPERAAARWTFGAGWWTGLIWLAGVIVLTVRLIVAGIAVDRLVRRSSQAPEAIDRKCQAIARRLRCNRAVPVRVTSEFSSPCLVGIVRAVLLLPESADSEHGAGDLAAILAHELAHARNHDLAWNFGAHVVSILLWFHPLAWRIRAAHTAACDAVCDAVAADLVGDVVSYGRTLARLAVQASSLTTTHGLAMARTSDVGRRLDALNKKVFPTPLSRRRVGAVLCVGSVLLMLVGGLGFTRTTALSNTEIFPNAQTGPSQTAGPATSRASNAPAGYRIRGRVIDSGGRPVHAAKAVLGRSRSDALLPTVTTDVRGEFVFEKCADESTVVTIQAEGFAPDIREVRVNERLEPIEFRLQPAAVLRLRVVDVRGTPVDGAFVFTQTWREYKTLDLREKTDSQGRFVWHSAPRRRSVL